MTLSDQPDFGRSATGGLRSGSASQPESGGKALFLWAVKKDEHGRDVHRQLQDKLAKS